ncbi:MAG: PAS domain S-box protein [Syntrophobacterales bacterium]|jgi:two-component system sensor histidine kinase HydH|nr:PAS domain S-box protein [Syntrophobacterales bacterium]
MKKKIHPAWFNISPWIVLAMLVVLAPVMTIMTIQDLKRQRLFMTELLREKGFAMIRSFEAGLRSNPQEMWTPFELQKFLMESAQQPDMDYMVITDLEGTIIADSDPSLLGEKYDPQLPLREIAARAKPEWRQFIRPDGADTFEVYKTISTHGVLLLRQDIQQPLILFIGLDTGPLSAAQAADMRYTVGLGLFVLLLIVSGIISLALAQSYRSSESLLARIRIFSKTIIEKMPMGLFVFDHQKNLALINQAGELISLRISGDQPPGSIPSFLVDLLREMEQTGSTLEKETDISTADGKTVSLGLIGSPLHEEKGTIMGYLFLARDITEILSLRKEKDRNQRLATVGSLAAGIAHEIRNPLSSIKGFATYFKERYKDHKDDGEIADILIAEVERVNRVITQLLDFSRPVIADRHNIPAKKIIEQSLKKIESQIADRTIHIQKNLPDEQTVIWFDADKMEQVLLNLYMNALDAMPKGGTLTVSMAAQKNDMVQITITDTGCGIAPKDLARIYDPYFTTKSTGTGIGLAIVHRILEFHNGRIHVESEEGQGTTVTLLLPREKPLASEEKERNDTNETYHFNL